MLLLLDGHWPAPAPAPTAVPLVVKHVSEGVRVDGIAIPVDLERHLLFLPVDEQLLVDQAATLVLPLQVFVRAEKIEADLQGATSLREDGEVDEVRKRVVALEDEVAFAVGHHFGVLPAWLFVLATNENYDVVQVIASYTLLAASPNLKTCGSFIFFVFVRGLFDPFKFEL